MTAVRFNSKLIFKMRSLISRRSEQYRHSIEIATNFRQLAQKMGITIDLGERAILEFFEKGYVPGDRLVGMSCSGRTNNRIGTTLELIDDLVNVLGLTGRFACSEQDLIEFVEQADSLRQQSLRQSEAVDLTLQSIANGLIALVENLNYLEVLDHLNIGMATLAQMSAVATSELSASGRTDNNQAPRFRQAVQGWKIELKADDAHVTSRIVGAMPHEGSRGATCSDYADKLSRASLGLMHEVVPQVAISLGLSLPSSENTALNMARSLAGMFHNIYRGELRKQIPEMEGVRFHTPYPVVAARHLLGNIIDHLAA